MKKFFIGLLITAVFLSFTACRRKEETGPKVTIWHWMSDRHQNFRELAKEYYQGTGTTVHFNLFPHDAYPQRISAAAAANDLPDVFGILGEKRVLASFAKEGRVKNLLPYMKNLSWKDNFVDIALSGNIFKKENIYQVDPGIYGVPIDAMSIQFLYNKNLLEKVGFDPGKPPQTFQEFLEIAKKAGEMPRVYGFVSGWGETWMLECLATNYAFNIMGKEKFFATIKGEVPYTDPEWIKVFSLFQKLEEAGILAPGIATMNNKEAEQVFATERAFFTFNGSWGVNTYRQMNPELKYAAMPPPQAGTEHPPGIWAGAGASFMVNAESEQKKEAIAFLKWLTSPQQQKKLSRQTNNLPAVIGLEESVSENLRQFTENQEYFTHPMIWPRNENSRVVEAMNEGIQNIIIGAKTPEEVAKEIDRVKQRHLD